jgi:hypothetical protein
MIVSLAELKGVVAHRGVKAAVYIQDMFETGHDAANRSTVARYKPESLPLVGIGLRADRA